MTRSLTHLPATVHHDLGRPSPPLKGTTGVAGPEVSSAYVEPRLAIISQHYTEIRVVLTAKCAP